MNEVTVKITTPLRKFVGGQREVRLPAGSVGEALRQLGQRYPELEGRLTDSEGGLREFIQVHVGKTPLRQLGGLPATLKPGDVISVSSPFSGG